MTEQDFRRMALSMPEAVESAHMGHADFRVNGKIFATLGSPKEGWGMVKLTPDQQSRLVGSDPETFVPATGAWGARGGTHVRLQGVRKGELRSVIIAAWRNTAPTHLL